MIYKKISGKIVDTDKEKVVCPWCHKEISKIDINNGDVYYDGVSNESTGENWCELIHIKCAEEANEVIKDLS